MIPTLVPLIEPLTTRFPSAWKKCQAPHDDGEFNARVCAVLHYELGLTQVGRNGKRGDPKNLSRDIINWKGEGPNFDPTDGNTPCTIIDFIGSHELPSANIIQITPDPNGPGAWVKPLTLGEIDAGAHPAQSKPLEFPPRDLVGQFFAALDAKYQQRGAPNRVIGGDPLHIDNEGLFVWVSEYVRHFLIDHPEMPLRDRSDAATAAVLADIDRVK